MKNLDVTIICDASFCPETKASGYGVWIAGDEESRSFEGVLVNPGSSVAAECMAIAKALERGISNGLISNTNGVIVIQSDCKKAIDFIKNKYTGNNRKILSASIYVKDCMKKFNLKINMRYVRGHSSGESCATRSQILCDMAARRQMLKERKRIISSNPDMKVSYNVRKESEYLADGMEYGSFGRFNNSKCNYLGLNRRK